MTERTEEKYLIGYHEYSAVSDKVKRLLEPDQNGCNGKYSVCSLYFDDNFDSALREKEDGNAVHTKYRIRTYDGDGLFVRLERKIKCGTITRKRWTKIEQDEIERILCGEPLPETSGCFDLASEIRSKALQPKIAVRYDREAYIMSALGIRVTFDLNIDILPPDKESLFGKTARAIPALPRNEVVMEIKYLERCPSFLRKCCNSGMQISVSKYALARSVL